MKDYLIGIDCGSTTVKCVVLDSESGEILYKKYKRHHSKVKEEVVSQLAEIKDIVRNGTVRVAISGSAGLGLAESAGLPFVQEVFATKAACDELLPGFGCGAGTGWRGCENTVSYRRQRGENERLLCRRDGRLYRPDGVSSRCDCNGAGSAV